MKCLRCGAAEGLEIIEWVNRWNPVTNSISVSCTYRCKDLSKCSFRTEDDLTGLPEIELWILYREGANTGRYTERQTWNNGRRLTFKIARELLANRGYCLQRGSDSLSGFKSGFILDGKRYQSLINLVKFIVNGGK